MGQNQSSCYKPNVSEYNNNSMPMISNYQSQQVQYYRPVPVQSILVVPTYQVQYYYPQPVFSVL